MTERRDLDAELTSLFADERLTVTPRDDATELVLAGARRRRQRRGVATALTGVAVTAAVIAGGIAVTADGSGRPDRTFADPTLSRRAAPPPTTSTGTTTGTSTPGTERPSATTTAGGMTGGQPPPVTGLPGDTGVPTSTTGTTTSITDIVLLPAAGQLGPIGVRGPSGYLSLDTPKQKALDSGLLEPDPNRRPGCADYRMRDYASNSGPMVRVVVTGDGVVAFSGRAMRNADGIRTGSSTDEVLRRYPKATVGEQAITADVADNPAADYVFGIRDDVVTRIDLTKDEYAGCI